MSHMVPLECLESVRISWYYILKYKVSSSRCLYAYIIHIVDRISRAMCLGIEIFVLVTLRTKIKCVVKILNSTKVKGTIRTFSRAWVDRV